MRPARPGCCGRDCHRAGVMSRALRPRRPTVLSVSGSWIAAAGPVRASAARGRATQVQCLGLSAGAPGVLGFKFPGAVDTEYGPSHESSRPRWPPAARSPPAQRLTWRALLRTPSPSPAEVQSEAQMAVPGQLSLRGSGRSLPESEPRSRAARPAPALARSLPG